MRRRDFAILFALFIILAFFQMGTQAIDLVYFAFRSFLRMGGAYVLSIIFSFTVGILIMHNKRAYEFIFPALDILQAIPILGFFPFALLFFVYTFPGGMLGEELSSIFLIFTAMTWAIVFAVIESAASITHDMRDLARMVNLKGARYLTHVIFPVSFPQFISGSITGWGGGWYFLVASEYLALGSDKIALPGLGAFIAKSAFSYNMVNALLGLAMLAFIVIGMNLYLWQPLLRKAKGYASESQLEKAESNTFLADVLDRAYAKFCKYLEKTQKFSEKALSYLSISPEHAGKKEEKGATAVAFAFIMAVAAVFLYFLFFRMPHLLTDFTILVFASSSFLRLVIAFIIALLWTSMVAVFLAKNKSAMRILMPLFDLGQSIPAVSLFPIFVILIVQTIGGRAGLEVASILLVLTGMQWYLLFNLIRAVQNIPEDILDLSKLMRIETFAKLRHVLVPSILPAVFIGGIEAMGGGWNASIISEFIIGPEGKPFEMPGLGYLLSYSAIEGNIDGMILAVSGITLIILLTNRLVWKPLLRDSDKYKF